MATFFKCIEGVDGGEVQVTGVDSRGLRTSNCVLIDVYDDDGNRNASMFLTKEQVISLIGALEKSLRVAE